MFRISFSVFLFLFRRLVSVVGLNNYTCNFVILPCSLRLIRVSLWKLSQLIIQFTNVDETIFYFMEHFNGS